jgi:2-polyprenyl-3-methyl-5-hydroxy-6-metoxy-1,4-benzoquinol methylase
MEREAASRATYTAEQFAPLFAAEDGHFWFHSRNLCIAAALRSLPDFPAIRDVLEVGCGNGIVLAELQRLFPAGRVTGMDLFEEGLKFARQRFSGTLIQGDVFTHDFGQPFDLIGAFDVIEHLDDDAKILRRFWQQLKPGGHLIVTVPAHMSLWSYFDEVAHHRRRYTSGELTRKLAAAGFTVDHTTQFMAALFPPMWIKRKLLGERAEKLSVASAQQRQAAVESDLKINPLVNQLFKMLLWPEAFFISHRLHLPLGTSLLAIATRPVEPANPNRHD